MMIIKNKLSLLAVTLLFSSTTFAATSYFCPSSVTITCNQQSCKSNYGKPGTDSVSVQIEPVAPLSSNDFKFKEFGGNLSTPPIYLKQGQRITTFFDFASWGTAGGKDLAFDCAYLSSKDVTVDGARVLVIVSAKPPASGYYFPDFNNSNWSKNLFFAGCDESNSASGNEPQDCPLIIKDN